MCETGGFAHSLHGRIYGDPDNKRRSTPLLRPGQQVAIRSFVEPRTAIMVPCPYDRTNRLLDAGTDHKRSPHAELGAPTSFATNHTPKIAATTANKYAQRARPHVSSAKVGPDRIPPEIPTLASAGQTLHTSAAAAAMIPTDTPRTPARSGARLPRARPEHR